jgi:hypothetical protein
MLWKRRWLVVAILAVLQIGIVVSYQGLLRGCSPANPVACSSDADRPAVPPCQPQPPPPSEPKLQPQAAGSEPAPAAAVQTSQADREVQFLAPPAEPTGPPPLALTPVQPVPQMGMNTALPQPPPSAEPPPAPITASEPPPPPSAGAQPSETGPVAPPLPNPPDAGVGSATEPPAAAAPPPPQTPEPPMQGSPPANRMPTPPPPAAPPAQSGAAGSGLPPTPDTPPPPAAPPLPPPNMQPTVVSPARPEAAPTVPTPPPARPAAQPVPPPANCPWVLRIENHEGKTHVEAVIGKEVQFQIVCDQLDLQAPRGSIQAKGDVRITGSGLDGKCQGLKINWQDDHLYLEGEARLKCLRDGQDVDLSADWLNLKLSASSTLKATGVSQQIVPAALQMRTAPQTPATEPMIDPVKDKTTEGIE